MSINYFKQNKGIISLVLGWIMGIVMVGMVSSNADKTISRLEIQLDRTISSQYSYIERTNSVIESLKSENKSLKQRSKTTRVVLPNGTVRETTESASESTESSTTITRESHQRELAERLETQERTLRKEFSETVSQTKHLSVAGGYSTRGYYVGLTYTVSPPFLITAFGAEDGSFGAGIGIRL